MKDIKIKLKNAGKFIVLKMIRLYQLAISPYKGGKYCTLFQHVRNTQLKLLKCMEFS